jgi:parallel beta-helix repeat protein
MTAISLLIGWAATKLNAATFYVDPVNGDMNNSGSYNSPWRTLQEVFENELIQTRMYEQLPPGPNTAFVIKNEGAPVKAGDTILLRDGYHGEVDYRGAYNADYVTIAAEEGHTPYLKRIKLESVSKWIIRGITVSPELSPGGGLVAADLDRDGTVGFEDFSVLAAYWDTNDCGGRSMCLAADIDDDGTVDYEDLAIFVNDWLWQYSCSSLISIVAHSTYGPCWDAIIEDNTLFSTEDSSGWDVNRWNMFSCLGVYVECPNSVVRNNDISNVDFGIQMNGADNTLVSRNTIEHISADGMAVGANDVTVEYNILKNFYKVSSNHNDAMQFHRGLNPYDIPINNITLRGNVIISDTGETASPLIASPMGISGFEGGMYHNWRIENNVIMLQHTNGLVVRDITDSVIINNIVFDPKGQAKPMLSVGTNASNVVVRNNMAQRFGLEGQSITADHNLDIDDYDPNMLFVSHGNFDLRHKEGSIAIDAGSSELAPSIDIDGHPRPCGSAPDIGAYEYILPVDLVPDGIVDFGDVAVLGLQWGQTQCEAQDWCGSTDLNQNGTVEIMDLVILTMHWLDD